MNSIVEEEPAPKHMTLAVILGVVAGVIGFFGSIFGPVYIGAIGVVLVIAGLAGRRRAWGIFALKIGLGIVAGACAYVILGLLIPDGAASVHGRG